MLPGAALLLFLAAFLFSGAEVRAAPPRQVVVLLVDALSPAELADPAWANVRRAAGRGAVGLMSSRAGGPHTAPSAYLTLAAGERVRAPALAGLTLAAYESYGLTAVRTLYATLRGEPAGGAALFLGAAQVWAAVPSTTVGRVLAEAGLGTAAIGNADTFSGGIHEHRRLGALLAADERGVIPYGDVGTGTLAFDPGWPFGWRTDYDATWRAFQEAAADAHLLVVELGDLARLDAYADWLTEEQRRRLRRETLERVDEFVGRLLLWLEEGDRFFLLLSPSPPREALQRGFLLTPVVAAPLEAGAGASPGLVRSATTRRAGLITNLDIAPTVLAALGLEPTRGGTPVQAAPPEAVWREVPYGASAGGDPWVFMEELYRRATLTNSLRGPFVRGFVGVSILVFLGWCTWLAGTLATGARGPEKALPLWRWLLLLISAAPLAALVLPLLPPPEPPWSLALLAAVAAAAATAFGFLFRRGVDAFVALSLATAALLFLDVALGARLVKNSVLGYDPIVAARFYGLGNEYMGVFIGSCLIGASGLLDRLARGARRRAAVAATCFFFLGGVGLLASPSLGANVGGTMAAVAGFGSAGILLSGRELSWRRLLGLAAAVAVVLAAAAALDVTLHRDAPSHLGRALLLFLREGWAPVAAIAARKLAMNLSLLRWTIWSQVFVVSLGITTVALYRPGETVRRADQHHPFLLKGIRGALVGALAALAANDSGVVAAATLMIPVTSTLVYVLLSQRAASFTTKKGN